MVATPSRPTRGIREPVGLRTLRLLSTACRLRDWEGACRSHARSPITANGAELYTTDACRGIKNEIHPQECGRAAIGPIPSSKHAGARTPMNFERVVTARTPTVDDDRVAIECRELDESRWSGSVIPGREG
jgi:hypothetical protein